MRGKALFLIGILLLGIVFPSNLRIANAQDNASAEDFSYYFISYSGEENVVTINENVTLTLTTWTDESKSAVNGKISIYADSSIQTKDIILNVNADRNELAVSETEKIYYRIAVSESYKAEFVTPLELNDQHTVVTQNENGTFIEEVKTVDEYSTVVLNKGLVYFSTDENSQKIEITKEQYDSLNALSESPSVEESTEEEADFDQQTVGLDSLNAQVTSLTPSVKYSSHVQGIGWQTAVTNGAVSGTIGEGRRVEAVQVSLENTPYTGSISYKTHVQTYGWLPSVSDGLTSGTTGEGKQVEAIQINLTGDMAKYYDVYYRVHSQTFGWLGWAKNGQSAGTEGLSKRVEALQVVLVEKGGAALGSTDHAFLTKPSVAYSTHVQSYGWINYVKDGAMSGTEGEAKRLEAIKIQLENTPYSGAITYSTHVQGIGWLSNVSNGAVSGTLGQSKRLEAIKIQLTGEIANYYDVYYRVHAQNFGWLGWAKNGQSAGTEGLSKRLEAIEIVLVAKGGAAPGSTDKSFVTKPSVIYSTHVQSYGWMGFVADGALSGTEGQAKRVEAIKIDLQNAPYSGGITYSTHIQGYGWLNNVSNGAISGKIGESKRMEAIKINLTGEMANYYDVYYRVHAQSFGWLGWAKNGMKAGSEGYYKRVEAIQIKLVPKGQGEPASEQQSFKEPITVFLDPGHGGSDPGAVAGGVKEANLNLAVAKKVQALLVSRGYRVYMSRTTDTYVDLYDRPRMANELKADIFVSIHTNSTGTSSTSAIGIESYYYEYDPNYPSKINTAMHNDPDRIAKSMTLTNFIQGNMIEYTGAYDRGTDGDTFAVIRESAMPATLLEMGFINNTTERQKLVTDSYQSKIARGIADGIVDYFRVY